jgi:hypothetical protein
MGPPQFLHGGNSAAALDTLCGVFLNGIVENFASFDEGEIDPSKWTIGGNRTVKFDLTYRWVLTDLGCWGCLGLTFSPLQSRGQVEHDIRV